METERQSLRTAMAGSVTEDLPAEAFLRFLLAGVAFAAGVTGALLLAIPGSTSRWFSWGLEPEPLAGLIGGSYVASAYVFGYAFGKEWRKVRGLATGTLALTVPILIVTFAHLEVFDFRRWQAWAWVFLFLASPLSFGAVLFLRRGAEISRGPRLSLSARAPAAVLALLFFAIAVALWRDPETSSKALPFALPPLGGRVLGCWNSFLAFLAGWSAVRGNVHEARIPLLGLAAFSLGSIAGCLRNFQQLKPQTESWGYVVALLVLVVATTVLATRARTASSR